ncbi:hypothetical protein U27_01223 [Candidatus Vecturithrix granuli]|uniref:Uncharacterized protein n=1 Tax=Vecturithrix granuli TaxID=1499967 RepID=A0A081C9R8_VECG1|nr:hypothetical protein U27_01223 [Candidatus Vecturithrix granuli]
MRIKFTFFVPEGRLSFAVSRPYGTHQCPVMFLPPLKRWAILNRPSKTKTVSLMRMHPSSHQRKRRRGWSKFQGSGYMISDACSLSEVETSRSLFPSTSLRERITYHVTTTNFSLKDFDRCFGPFLFGGYVRAVNGGDRISRQGCIAF